MLCFQEPAIRWLDSGFLWYNPRFVDQTDYHAIVIEPGLYKVYKGYTWQCMANQKENGFWWILTDNVTHVDPNRRANPRAIRGLSDLQPWSLGSMVSASSLWFAPSPGCGFDSPLRSVAPLCLSGGRSLSLSRGLTDGDRGGSHLWGPSDSLRRQYYYLPQ